MLRSRLFSRIHVARSGPHRLFSGSGRIPDSRPSSETSTDPPREPHAEPVAPQDAPAESSADAVPWYLRPDVKSSLLDDKHVELPAVPSGAPAHVAEFLGLLASDYGIENLRLFDMTALDDTHEFRANNGTVDYVVVGTGKSERHIFKAAAEFRSHLKHKYDVIPVVEGMVSSANTPAMRRRLLRRARKGPSATDNDYGRAANSWVLFHHDGVDVHLLTAERRDDLKLETLWCAPDELHLYDAPAASARASDSIFAGIRRLHTRASSAAAHPQGPESRHDDSGANFERVRKLHMEQPERVSLQDVEDALLEKYASASAVGRDLAADKVDDVTAYARLLVDTKAPGKAACDAALHRLSAFIAVLYRFSTDRLQLGANPQLIPLLWRLTYTDAGAVTPKMVDGAVFSGVVGGRADGAGPPVELSSNNARNVLTVLDHHNAVAGTDFTPAFSELVLFTYGNAGKWDRFWAEWDTLSFAHSVESSVAVGRWVRLAVFLALTNHRAQNLRFLNSYWKNGSTVGGSFLAALRENGGHFNSPMEKAALVAAVEKMLAGFNQGAAFEGVRKDLLFEKCT